MQGVMAWLYQHESYIYPNQASRKIKNNSERPVDALDVNKMNDWLTHNLKSRDASASKKKLNIIVEVQGETLSAHRIINYELFLQSSRVN